VTWKGALSYFLTFFFYKINKIFKSLGKVYHSASEMYAEISLPAG